MLLREGGGGGREEEEEKFIASGSWRGKHNSTEEEEEEEEFIQNCTRARRYSERDGTNTLSRNAGFYQSADEVRTLRRRRRTSLLRIVHARGAIPNEMGPTRLSREEEEEFIQNRTRKAPFLMRWDQHDVLV